jgi:hypothetical protein
MRWQAARLSRRGTLRLLGAAPIAAGLALRGSASHAAPPRPPAAPVDKPYWIVRPDGSFDLVTPAIQLRDCYPAFDGVPIRAVSVKVGPGPCGATDALYRLASGGSVQLRFRETAETLVLGTSLRRLPNAPFSVQPLSGRVEGARQLFRQGLGFSGPSGLVDLASASGLWAHDSYLVTALRAADGASLALAARDHGRFLQKTTFCNRPSRRALTNRDVEADPWLLEAGFSTERVPVGEELALPNLHLYRSASTWEACRQAAEDVAKAMGMRAGPARYYWCSWYNKGRGFGLDDLRELLDGLDAVQPPLPLQAIQIDDGYCSSPGDWLTPGPRFSEGGLQAAFDSIRSRRYAAGIWVAPFMVGSRSRLYREHPEWVIHDLEGRPVPEWRHYGPEDALVDPEHYALDASHPQAVEYLRTVFRTLRKWGATVFKTDFLDWGLKDTARVQRHDLTRTSVEAFREVMAMIREEIGPDSYWLACIAPYAPCLGFVDGMRVANDTSLRWSEGSQGNMLQETVATQYANAVLWRSDPDCVVLRSDRSELTPDEVESLALWSGILGGAVTTSDALHRLPKERLALWRFLEPGDGGTALLPLWERPRALQVAVRRYSDPLPQAWAVLALNPAAAPVTERLELAALVGQAEAFVWEWGPGRATALGRRRELVFEAGRHAARLYYVSPEDAPPPADLTIGGRRLGFALAG